MSDAREQEREITEARVRAVRVGHGANCSSIGSVIDTLFVTATVGASVFAAVVAALAREDVRIAGAPPPPGAAPPPAPAPARESSARGGEPR